MPNLFSDLPVAILAWVLASTSGLTRSETQTVRPFEAAICDSSVELGLGFHVDAENAGIDRGGEFVGGLADRRRT